MDADGKQGKGGSLMVIGLVLWVAGLLILFYVPTGIRTGHQPMFEGIVIVLGAPGAVLMGRGWRIRRGG